MTFHITYNLTREQNRDKVQQKFKSTGALPPKGVTMRGRWHSVNGNEGYIIAEANEIETVGQWIQEWSDLLTFEVMPVLTDEQVGRIIG
ncbi:MAG TPA: DUF3303 family protein [Balneolales bacterium]|jgi:hypothetical protein|nr:DUF3303 family protein [Balneolales bacterium]